HVALADVVFVVGQLLLQRGGNGGSNSAFRSTLLIGYQLRRDRHDVHHVGHFAFGNRRLVIANAGEPVATAVAAAEKADAVGGIAGFIHIDVAARHHDTTLQQGYEAANGGDTAPEHK